MSHYCNPYFKMKIEFPEDWKCRYLGSGKINTKHPDQYQSSHDDLPVDEKNYKILFRGFSRIKGSPSILSCEAALAVFYRVNTYDPSAERNFSDSELVRKTGAIEFLGIEAKYFYLEYNCGDYTHYQNRIYWEHETNIWLDFAFSGDTQENFTVAKSIFDSIKNI